MCEDHFSTPLTSENSLLRPVPRLVSATTSATAIKLAINAYSIAVAPRSSSKSFLTDRIVIIEIVPSFVLACFPLAARYGYPCEAVMGKNTYDLIRGD